VRGRSQRTPQKRAALLDAVVEFGGNVKRACESADIARTTVYGWSKDDPQFKADLEEAIQRGADLLEDEARRRAHDGVDEPVFYQGEQCGVIRKYSDTLLIFLLKGAKPERYRERYGHEIAGPNGQPLSIGVGVVLELPANGRDANPGPKPDTS